MKKILDLIVKLKNDYEFRKFIVYTCLRMLTPLIGFVNNVIIVRKITKSDNGVYNLAIMVTSFIITFGFSWHSTIISYYGSVDIKKNGNMVRTFWVRNILVFSGIILVSLLFSVYKDAINSYVGANVAFIILSLAVVRIIKNYVNEYFLAVQKQILTTFMKISGSVMTLILALLLRLDVKTILQINILSDVFFLVFITKIDFNHFKGFKFDKEYFFECLKFSFSQLLGFSGIYIINFGDNAVIKYFLTIEDVSTYNIAYKMFESFVSLRYIFVSYFTASIAVAFHENKKDVIKSFYYKTRIYAMGVLLFIHICLFIFSGIIVNVFFKERYLDAIPIYRVLLIGSFFYFFSVFYVFYYNINKKYLFLQMLNLFRALVNIVLDIILIKPFSILGPAIATSLAIMITCMISYLYCEKKIKTLLLGGIKDD